jgi:hypothetical protein
MHICYSNLFASLCLALCVAGQGRAQTPQDWSSLEKIYLDESHCLVAPEIRTEEDRLISCYCRDALADARYVYRTYLLSGKDRNLKGTYIALIGVAEQQCGEAYDVLKATEDAWQWTGPEVIRRYPSDEEIDRITPDALGWRTVIYEVSLLRRDKRGRIEKLKSFTASERLPPTKK